MLKQQAKVIARTVYLLDLLLTTVAFFGAFFIRDYVLPQFLPTVFPTGLYPIQSYLKIYPLVLIVWSLLLFSHQSYNSHRTVSLLQEAKTTLKVVIFGTVLLGTVAWMTPLKELSRSWFALFGLLAGMLLVVEKMGLRLLARYIRARGLNYRTVLMVGTGRQAREAAQVIESHRYWGYKIVGFISDGHRLPGKWSRYRLMGPLSELRRVIEEAVDGRGETIDEVVFAVNRRKLEAVEPIFLLCEEVGIRTRVAMNFFPSRQARVEMEELEGVPFVTYTTTPTDGMHLAGKRILDVSVSLFVLTVTLPLMLLIALGIKLTSPGRILFKQRRMGLNGRVFTLYKFRTMIEDADRRRADVEHLNEMKGPVFKSRLDPRVTGVGRLLRRFSLDEIPQLWNVFRGDMSLVGPRPPIPEEVNLYERWQRRRLSMKPGLTCLWQISGRNDIDFDRWIQLDLQYIDNWSPSLDLKILLRTIPAVLSGKGAS